MILNHQLETSAFAQKLVAMKHRRKRTRRVMVAGLMLTSMVDMFSLLVIFLLQSFSNSPEVMALSKNIVLPAAITASAPIDAPVLTVMQDQVLLDQHEVASPKDIAANPNLLIQPLQQLRQHWQQSHAGEEFKGDIHLQADRHLASDMISRLINIVNSQGYTSVQLAVVSGGNR